MSRRYGRQLILMKRSKANAHKVMLARYMPRNVRVRVCACVCVHHDQNTYVSHECACTLGWGKNGFGSVLPISGADCMGHGGGGTCPPHFYKWLGTGAPWVEEQQTRNWLNCSYWPSRKRSPKRPIVLLESKKVEGHDQKLFPGFAPGSVPPPTFAPYTDAPSSLKFVPAPLLPI